MYHPSKLEENICKNVIVNLLTTNSCKGTLWGVRQFNHIQLTDPTAKIFLLRPYVHVCTCKVLTSIQKNIIENNGEVAYKVLTSIQKKTFENNGEINEDLILGGQNFH